MSRIGERLRATKDRLINRDDANRPTKAERAQRKAAAEARRMELCGAGQGNPGKGWGGQGS